MNCNNCCKPNRLCSHYIISNSVTVVTVDGTDTLLIDIPARTYGNCQKYCIVVRTLPATGVMTNMPVAISIGGNTTTVYPLICGRTGLQAVGCQVNGRSVIKVCVRTNATSGVFRAFEGLNCYCPDVLASLPIPTTAPATLASLDETQTRVVKTSKASTSTEEGTKNV